MKKELSFYFIINPISGNGKGKKVAIEIENSWKGKNISFEIHFTHSSGDAIRLAKLAISSDKAIIVAVGGDGTVNELAGVLAGSEKKLGIIPIGSGNGLARELMIPLNTKAAIRNLLSAGGYKMDIGLANEKVFACTAGIGFDAYMGEKFESTPNRGILGYIKLFFKEFFNYPSKEYSITIDGKTKKVTAFIITIGNCKQWGNNFYISPKSINNDGKIELCIIKKFPKIIFPVLVYHLLNKNIDKSLFYEYYQGKNITIEADSPLLFHTDGESQQAMNKVEFYAKNKTLCVISKKS